VLILRVARFFPEPANAIAIYRLYTGVDLRDVVTAHGLALQAEIRAYHVLNIAARSPLTLDEMEERLFEPQRVILRHVPAAGRLFAQLGWSLPTRIDRVDVMDKAARDLGYRPVFNFGEYLRETCRRTALEGRDEPTMLAEGVDP